MVRKETIVTHDMCDDDVIDTDGTHLGCMRSAGHWERNVTPHHDASEERSWVHDDGVVLIWDGSVRRRQASYIRQGAASRS